MKAVHEKIEGPFAIEEDIALYGMITGDATLRRGVRFILHGTIAGNLTIERGARAIVTAPSRAAPVMTAAVSSCSGSPMPSPTGRKTPLPSSTPPPMSGGDPDEAV